MPADVLAHPGAAESRLVIPDGAAVSMCAHNPALSGRDLDLGALRAAAVIDLEKVNRPLWWRAIAVPALRRPAKGARRRRDS